MKKHVAIVLACAVVFICTSCFFHGQKGEQSGESASEEPMEITVSYWNITDLLKQNADTVKELETALQIRLVPRDVTADDYDKKNQVWAQTGQFPDLFVGNYRMDTLFRQWSREGLIHEIPDDLSGYPALAEYLSGHEVESCRIGETLYCIFLEPGRTAELRQLQQTVLYRADLARLCGIEEIPDNWKGFRGLIRSICVRDPWGTQIEGLVVEDRNMLTRLLVPYSNPMAVMEGAGFEWVENGAAGYIPAYFSGETLGDDMLPALCLARLMYEEGSIARDAVFISGSQAVDNFLRGKAAAICVNGSYEEAKQRLGEYWKEINGSDFSQAIGALPFLKSIDGEFYSLPEETFWSEVYIGGHVDEEKLDRILQLLNYLLAERASKEEAKETFSQYDEVRLKQVQQMKERNSVPLCREAYLDMERNFRVTVTEDLIDIMTGKREVEEMWNEYMEKYRSKGLDSIALSVNRAIRLLEREK